MRVNKKSKIDNLESFDSVKYLVDEETITAYLADIKTANNPQLTTLALENIQQARNMNSTK